MSIIEKLIGRRQRQEPGEPELTGPAGEMLKTTQSHLEIVRYACTSAPWDHDRVARYISMAESTGMKFPAQDRKQMLNANAFFFPKREPDGTVLNGFEQLRIEMIEAHCEALTGGIQILRQLSPEPATVAFLKRVAKEMKKLTRHV